MSVTITAKQDKFRRCGTVHSKEPQTYKDGHYTKSELKTLKNEPMLMVQDVPDNKDARPNAKDSIEAVKAAENIEALDTLAKSEDRKSVLEAIEKRRAELSE